jgi:PKD repeat protein
MPKPKKTVQRSTVTLHLDSIAKTMKKLLLISTAVLGLTVAHGQPCTNNPTASFTSIPACLGNAITLTDASVAPNGDTITMWNWTMPGGIPPTATSQNTSTTYATSGMYTVTLVVTTQLGCKDTIQQQVIVYAPPVANFSSTTDSGGATFTDLSYSTNGNIMQWSWSFPGGNPSTNTAQNPVYIAYPTGTYSACLTITTNYGCTDTYCQTITITSINENYIEAIVSISPNPFSVQTTLQTDNLLHNATLTVYNCFGQTVAQIKNINGQTVTFSRDNLVSGLYFVRLTEDNKIFTDKLIITDR